MAATAEQTNKCGTDGASLRYFTFSSAQSCQCLTINCVKIDLDKLRVSKWKSLNLND